jgi:pyridoxamine 5'-phosphate oxidase
VIELSEHALGPDPMPEVERWVDEARAAAVRDWDAMVVATATPAGEPSARVVLLRGLDARGFCFYTSYSSRKGHELAENPRAAVVLHWREQGRQVRATGDIVTLTDDESRAYWDQRPRASRLSAWASRQSEPVADRTALEREVDAVAARFRDEVPLPPFWGGYRLVPREVELWQHRDDRLHDRVHYGRRGSDPWLKQRLQP